MKIKDENGEVMIESMLVMLMTMFVLMVILSIGFLLYEQCSVRTVAEDTATKIAQTYKWLDADATTGYISEDQIDDLALFRYGLLGGSTYENENITKAVDYAKKRLNKVNFAVKEGDPKVTVEVFSDGIGRNHVVVTVKAKYRILFGEFLPLTGFESSHTYESKASADCMDILDYYNTVKFSRRCSDYLDKNSTIVSSISSWIKVFSHDY